MGRRRQLHARPLLFCPDLDGSFQDGGCRATVDFGSTDAGSPLDRVITAKQYSTLDKSVERSWSLRRTDAGSDEAIGTGRIPVGNGLVDECSRTGQLSQSAIRLWELENSRSMP